MVTCLTGIHPETVNTCVSYGPFRHITVCTALAASWDLMEDRSKIGDGTAYVIFFLVAPGSVTHSLSSPDTWNDNASVL